MAKCTTITIRTGTDYSSDSVNLGVPVMVIFTRNTFSLSDTNIVLLEKIMEQVRQNKAIPVKIESLATNHVEAKTVTHDSGRESDEVMPEKRKYTVTADTNFCVKKELLKLRGFKGGVIFVSNKNKLWGYHPSDGVNKGLPLDLVKVKTTDVPDAKGDAVPVTTIMFNLANVESMEDLDFIDTIDQQWNEILGITPVTIAATSGATQIATKLYVDVYSDCGEGCELPVTGLTVQCFKNSASGASITSISEVSDGSYELTGTGFANAQEITVVPWVTGMTYDGYPYESPTALTVTGIA